MRAAVLKGVGGPEQLVVEEVPEPEAADGQAIVDVRAAGINFADVLIRLGMYPQMPELPAVLGSEIAGELDGARVMGFVRSEGGGYAERVVVDRRWLLPLPESASFAEGAAFPMAFLTAWIPLTELVRIAFGARVLVTAAAGAVGTAAVQIVKALNGHPVAAVGSEEKLELPRSLGAVEAVTYEQIGELDPVDVVFDLVGGEVFAASLSLLKPMGTAIAVGYAGGMWQEVEPGAGSWAATSASTASTSDASSAAIRSWSRARPRTSSDSGKEARCGRSSAPSSRSRRQPRRIVSSSPANRQERSC